MSCIQKKGLARQQNRQLCIVGLLKGRLNCQRTGNLDATTALRDRLAENTVYFREQMTALGFDIKPGVHPIVPIMLYDARLAQDMARDLLAEGIYVIGFSFPVVPQGQARIRVQGSAAHSREQLDQCIQAFATVARKHGVLS